MKYKLLLILIASATITAAQDYDFKNYRYRVNGYKAMSLNSDLRGKSYSYIGSPKYYSISNNLRVDLNYNRFTNSEKHIKNIYYGISMNGMISNSENGRNSSQVSNGYGGLENFVYKNNLFRVSRAMANAAFNIDKKNPLKLIPEHSFFLIGGQYEIGKGEGRLENVTDPVMANFILNDMIPDDEEEIIGALKN